MPAIYKNKQFSQELQAVIEKGALGGVVGAYYLSANAFTAFDVRLYTSAPTVLPGLTGLTQGDVDTNTWAIFGDFSYDINDMFSVSLGGRYTSDKRQSRISRRNFILGGSPLLGGSDGFGVGVPFLDPTSDYLGRRTDKASRVAPRSVSSLTATTTST